MCVNDLACTGATPLFFLDYMAVGRLDPGDRGPDRRVDRGRVRRRSAARCSAARPPSIPASWRPTTSTWPGSPSASSSATRCWAPTGGRRATSSSGIASSGLHSNGFSLVRALVDSGALAPDADLLLEPTRLYSHDLALLRDEGVDLHAAAHITGGGFPENLPRVFPDGLRPVVDPDDVGAHRGDRRDAGDGRGARGGRVVDVQHGHRHVSRCCPRPTRPRPPPPRSTGARVIGHVEAGDGACALAERFPIAVLVSGSGTNLQALIDRLHVPADSPVEIVLVVTSSAGRPGRGPRDCGRHPHRGRRPRRLRGPRGARSCARRPGRRRRPGARGARRVDEHPDAMVSRPIPRPRHQPAPVAVAGVPGDARDRRSPRLGGALHRRDRALRRPRGRRRSAGAAGAGAGESRRLRGRPCATGCARWSTGLLADAVALFAAGRVRRDPAQTTQGVDRRRGERRGEGPPCIGVGVRQERVAPVRQGARRSRHHPHLHRRHRRGAA